MNVLLTDYMVCPRCGPPFGLVLVAREVVDRRVRQGEFGCANCRDSFLVEDGFGDMRPQPRSAAPPRGEGARDGGAGGTALRTAAGLGVTDGPGIVVVWDGGERDVVGLAEIVPSVEVVVTGWQARGFASDGVSAMAVGPALPFRDGSVRGVVVAGAGEAGVGEAGVWRESARVLAQGGRIVAKASADALGRMSAVGCRPLVGDEEVLVAVREG